MKHVQTMKRIYEKPHITVIEMNLSSQILTMSDPSLPANYERIYFDEDEEEDDFA